jgi:hypothetical protein
MSSVISVIVGCIALCLLSGCHRSGTWQNDSGNWKRAFGEPTPKEIVVLHSVYWRTPHFTREDGWTFHIKAPASFHKKWLAAYKVKHPDAARLATLEDMKKDRPAWFLPKPMAAYEIWVLADEPYARFAMFVDEASGEFFVTDSG